jgi:hypothetical protein
MAALAHVGVALAGKKLAPGVPLGVLLLGAWAIDIVWAGFWLAGLDHFPAVGLDVPAPWSHGLLMAIIVSLVAAFVTSFFSRRPATRAFIGLLVFSHWVVDFITQPMGAAFPGAGFRMRVLFSESPTILGLGLYNSAAAMYICDYGMLLAGIVVYVWTVRRRRSREDALPDRGRRPEDTAQRADEAD